MFEDPLFMIATVACLIVFVILAIGIGTYAKGGEFNKKYGNKLMQARIAAQFIAILLILAYVVFSGGDA